MGKTKEILYILESFVWTEVADIIAESDSIEEAVEVSVATAKHYDLNHYVSMKYITDTIHEMWNEYWSDYAT